MGATGSAGQLAIQVAKHLGAGQVVGAGRNAELLARLPALGADTTVSLDGDPVEVADRLSAAAAEVDVVIDYLWGVPTERTITAVLTTRHDRGRALDWLQIGSSAGPTATLPSAAFRSANFRVLGSGQGSVGADQILAELPELARLIGNGTLVVNPVPVPLAQVEQAWTTPAGPGERLVLVP